MSVVWATSRARIMPVGILSSGSGAVLDSQLSPGKATPHTRRTWGCYFCYRGRSQARKGTILNEWIELDKNLAY